jgi:hypothetical protein
MKINHVGSHGLSASDLPSAIPDGFTEKMKSEHWTYPFYRQENTLSLTSMLHLGFKENWQMDNLLWTHNVVPREIEVL